MSVIDQYCTENARDFDGIVCEFYLATDDECALLKTTTMRDNIDKGSCKPFELVKHIVTGQLKRFNASPQFLQESDDIVAHVTEHLLQARLQKGAKLPILLEFIRRAAGCHLIDRLRQTRKEEQRNVPLVTKAAKDEPLAQNEIDETKFASPTQSVEPFPAEILLEKMLQKLAERTTQAGDPKTKTMCLRQEMVFRAMIHRRDQNISEKDAIQDIAARLGKEPRTIYRDIEALENFLRS